MSAHPGPPSGGPPPSGTAPPPGPGSSGQPSSWQTQQPHQTQQIQRPQHTAAATSPTDSHAPRLLPLAFVSAILVVIPLGLYVVLFGVFNIDLGSGSIVVLAVATLICLVGPVLGIVAGVRALRRCRSAPRIGGGLLVAGCALQALLMIVLCVVAPMTPTVMIALLIAVGGGALPALINLIGGILGLQRVTMAG